jgi:hypothetical protein
MKNPKKEKYFVVNDEWAGLLYYFHCKALTLDFESFYDKMTWQILNQRDFFEEILQPLASILKIEKGVPADKLYHKLRTIKPLSPSQLVKK